MHASVGASISPRSLPPSSACSSPLVAMSTSFGPACSSRCPLTSFLSTRLLLVLSAGLLLRILLLLFMLHSPAHRAGVPSPATEALLAPAAASFASFQEALTRYSLQISPYTDGAYKQQPLVFFFLKSLTINVDEDEICRGNRCKSRYFLLLAVLDITIAVSLAFVTAQARGWTAGWAAQSETPQELPLHKQKQRVEKQKMHAQHESDLCSPAKTQESQQQQLRRRVVLKEKQQQHSEDASNVQEGLIGSRQQAAQQSPVNQMDSQMQSTAKDACAASAVACTCTALPQKIRCSPSAAATAAKDTSGEVVACPALVAACYFLQPVTLATLLALSLHMLPLAVFAAALAAACMAYNAFARALCVFLYGLLLYVGPPQALLLALPLAVLMQSVRRGTVYDKALTVVLPSVREEVLPALLNGAIMLLAGLLVCCCLHVASFYSLGGAHDPSVAMYLEETVVAVWGVREMSPNLGVFWYAFALVFARYKVLFAILFQGHSVFVVVPLAVRLYRHPLALCIAIASVALLFQPLFCISDSAFILALLASREEVVRESSSFVKLGWSFRCGCHWSDCAWIHLKMTYFRDNVLRWLHDLSEMVVAMLSALVYPVMVELWLERNAGNANFVFALQLAHLILMSFLVVQWVRTIVTPQRLTSVYGKVSGGAVAVAAGENGTSSAELATEAPAARTTDVGIAGRYQTSH